MMNRGVYMRSSITMRRIGCFLFGAALWGMSVVSMTGCSSSSSQTIPLNIEVPQTRVTLLDGEYVGLQEYSGKHIAVLFWAKWCSKSRRALREFVALSAEAREEVVFLAVSLDKNQNEIPLREYLAVHPRGRVHFAFSGNGGDDEAALAFQAYEIPTVYLIDNKNFIVSKETSLDVLRQSVVAGVPQGWFVPVQEPVIGEEPAVG